jgi:hypothetical protein
MVARAPPTASAMIPSTSPSVTRWPERTVERRMPVRRARTQVVWRTNMVRPRAGTGSDGRMPRCASTRITPAVPASITSSLNRCASPPS